MTENCDIDGCLECSISHDDVCERCEDGRELTSEMQCQVPSSTSEQPVIVGKDNAYSTFMPYYARLNDLLLQNLSAVVLQV